MRKPLAVACTLFALVALAALGSRGSGPPGVHLQTALASSAIPHFNRAMTDELLAERHAEEAAAAATTTTVPSSAPQSHRPAGRLLRTSHAAGGAGGFAACVRGKESSNNYAYSGYYHGAYNMTLSHWNNYDGYPTPESAPPSVQDAKFQSDVAQGPAYMHQQYPVTSRACGG